MKKTMIRLMIGNMALAAILILSPVAARASMPVDPESKEGREMLEADRIKKDPKLFEQLIKKKLKEKHGLAGTPESSENGSRKKNNIQIQVHD